VEGEEKEGTAEDKVYGGDSGGNPDGPGGAERSGAESERVVDAGCMTVARNQRIDGTG